MGQRTSFVTCTSGEGPAAPRALTLIVKAVGVAAISLPLVLAALLRTDWIEPDVEMGQRTVRSPFPPFFGSLHNFGAVHTHNAAMALSIAEWKCWSCGCFALL